MKNSPLKNMGVHALVVFQISFVLKFGIALGQQELKPVLEIGKPAPDLVFENVQYFNRSTVRLTDLRGKWVILDFWSAICSPCITSLPKIDSLQKAFGARIQFFLVSWNDPGALTCYNKFRKKYNLDLPLTFNNDHFRTYKVPGIPHIVIIDDEGILRAVTSSSELTHSNMERMLKGDLTSIKTEPINQKSDFKVFQPLLTNGNGGEDTNFWQRSMLMKWNKSIPRTGCSYIDAKMYGNLIQVTGLPISQLYEFAYRDTLYPYPTRDHIKMKDNYGKYWMRPILETADSSALKWNFDSGENVYSYSLIVPKENASSAYMRSVMQSDLQNYFGYHVIVETRLMPCWSLLASEQARKALPTKGGPRVYEDYNYAGFRFKNVSLKEIICRLWDTNQHEPPFIDQTGITGNVDISIDADLLDFEEFKFALAKHGLLLKKSEAEMKVIVIRDKRE